MWLIAYIDDILVLAESKELLLDHLEVSARVPRVHHQYGKISDDPQSCHRVSRPHSELNHYGASPPTTEDKTNSSGDSETNETEDHLSLPPGTTVGENECNGVRNSPCPSLLSPSADGSVQYTGEEQPEL